MQNLQLDRAELGRDLVTGQLLRTSPLVVPLEGLHRPVRVSAEPRALLLDHPPEVPVQSSELVVQARRGVR